MFRFVSLTNLKCCLNYQFRMMFSNDILKLSCTPSLPIHITLCPLTTVLVQLFSTTVFIIYYRIPNSGINTIKWRCIFPDMAVLKPSSPRVCCVSRIMIKLSDRLIQMFAQHCQEDFVANNLPYKRNLFGRLFGSYSSC